MTLDEFDTADAAALTAPLRACCHADAWVAHVLAGRPYADRAALHAASRAAVTALDDAGLEQALSAHPRIGERTGAGTSSWSRQEQSGVAGADDAVRARLAQANAAYEQRFGRVYLVCATGRDASELLALCEARLHNDPATERGVVLRELAAITDLRLDKLLDEEAR